MPNVLPAVTGRRAEALRNAAALMFVGADGNMKVRILNLKLNADRALAHLVFLFPQCAASRHVLLRVHHVSDDKDYIKVLVV